MDQTRLGWALVVIGVVLALPLALLEPLGLGRVEGFGIGEAAGVVIGARRSPWSEPPSHGGAGAATRPPCITPSDALRHSRAVVAELSRGRRVRVRVSIPTLALKLGLRGARRGHGERRLERRYGAVGQAHSGLTGVHLAPGAHDAEPATATGTLRAPEVVTTHKLAGSDGENTNGQRRGVDLRPGDCPTAC